MRTAEYSALAAMSSRLIIAASMWLSLPAAASPPHGEATSPLTERSEIHLAGTPVTVTAPSPALAATPPVEGEPALSLEDRREIQQALITLGHLRSEPDGNFGSLTPTAIRQFQSFQGDPETGTLTQDERYKLLNMARHLLQLLQSPPVSPKGVTAVSLRGGPQRLLKAAAMESAGDYIEASYWYRLAANDDEAKAFTNLGTLMVRGQGVDKPDPAAAQQLWLSAAARGEPVAMFDLGTMYENGVGVTADVTTAKKWYASAAAKGHPQARDALKHLGG